MEKDNEDDWPKGMWCFAIGQFGWSLLSALITNWLVYFYQPDGISIAAGQTPPLFRRDE